MSNIEGPKTLATYISINVPPELLGVTADQVRDMALAIIKEGNELDAIQSKNEKAVRALILVANFCFHAIKGHLQVDNQQHLGLVMLRCVTELIDPATGYSHRLQNIIESL